LDSFLGFVGKVGGEHERVQRAGFDHDAEPFVTDPRAEIMAIVEVGQGVRLRLDDERRVP